MGEKRQVCPPQGGPCRKKIDDEVEEEPVDIYDEVDEVQYRKHKRDQLLNDDFIVDENGEGYAETGADEWDTPANYYSDEEDAGEEEGEEEEGRRRKRKIKKVKKAQKGQIANFFKKASETAAAKPKKHVATENMDDILAGFTATAVKKVKEDSLFGATRKRDIFSSVKPKSSTPLAKRRMPVSSLDGSSKKPKLSSDDFYTAMDFDDYLDTPSSPTKKTNGSKMLDIDLDSDKEAKVDVKTEVKTELKTEVKTEVKDEPMTQVKTEVKTEVKSESVTDDSVMDSSSDSDDDDIIVSRKRTTATVDRSVNLSSTKSKPAVESSPLKVEPSSEAGMPSSPSRIAESSFNKLDESVVTGESKSIRMYWMDFAEADGSLLLFGKIKTADGHLVSGCVQINGINREIYFLPRETRKVEVEEGEEEEPPEKVGAMDVYEEIVPLLLEKYGLETIKAKPETKKYAFEIAGVPKETEYLKVLLPFQTKKCRSSVMPATLEGETFWHVFGAGANIFETFVLQRNVMGPCWLDIEGADFSALNNSTHCQVELAVSAPEQLTPVSQDDNEPAPSLNVLALNVQSFLSPKSGKQEVGSVSLAYYRDLPQDSPTAKDLQPTDVTTLVRPVGGALALPAGLKPLASKKGFALRTFNNERALLNCLAAIVKKTDPDVFLGHKLEAVTLDILMHRMDELKVATWSHFGRIKRKQFPDKFARSGRNSVFLVREFLQGRMICDVGNELGQSLTPKCQSWELPEMYQLYCKENYTPMEVNLANPSFGDDAGRLLAALRENRMAVRMISEVAFDIQIISLSKQLTNLAGNAWSHTLGGTRAGRNEYILLHEFTRNNYIVPDKETYTQRQQRTKAESGGPVRAKAKYQGGLVFEPVKGLVKNYVTVMDFNSLYPSIIQEFNICFTTVDRLHLGEDELPKVPAADVPQGVLPKLLHELVSRRREVKKLLKDPRISPIERIQYDIKQRTLKITANSMYGCLGFVNSRFYAKQLAMLVTNRGREILMDTRQLAEGLALRVVYGDTDSVMIDTGCDTVQDALKIAQDFKLRVNERYRLLEIDIDNVFKKMLFHAKKKYAAVNCTLDSEGHEQLALEIKGLDMKRREFCPLLKEVSTYVLEKVLGDEEPESALNDIYTHVEEVCTALKANEVPLLKLKINTKLSKDPTQYPNGKTMPAVQVALRMRDQGRIVKNGSVITYVVTDENIDEGAAVAARARGIHEVLAKDSHYKPDADFYLEKQLFSPLSRLLEKVEGYDIVRMAGAMGLDSRRYEARARTIQNEDTLQPLESTVSDAERFRDSQGLELQCPTCHAAFTFGGLQSSKQYHVTFTGIKCSGCDTVVPALSISAQLEHFIRHQVSYYYAGYLECSDCGNHTRQQGVYGVHCLGDPSSGRRCTGRMQRAYTDKQLYNDLLYLHALFDVDKAKKRSLKPLYDEEAGKENVPAAMDQGELDALVEQSRKSFDVYQGVVNKYLENCGRRYVDMESIFGFMRR